MTAMIALVGDQPLPNFLPVRHYHPSAVVLVYTTKTQQKYEHLKVVLQKEVTVHGIETDPYDISAITSTLTTEFAKIAALSSQPLIFNLTGGTKPMSLAAYQIAQQHNASVIYLQSEGAQSVIDRYSWQDHRLYHQLQEPLPAYLSLCEVLDLHLGRGKDAAGKDIWKEKGPKVRKDDGHLFELAVAQALRDHDYEVMCGVIDSNSQVDIDVMIEYQNQTGIIECKIGGEARGFKGIQQLSTAMRYLRGTYTKQFLVINDLQTNDQQTVCKPLNISVISLLHYQKGMSALTQEDVDTLLTAIDKIMKMGMTRL